MGMPLGAITLVMSASTSMTITDGEATTTAGRVHGDSIPDTGVVIIALGHGTTTDMATITGAGVVTDMGTDTDGETIIIVHTTTTLTIHRTGTTLIITTTPMLIITAEEATTDLMPLVQVTT